VEPGYPPQIEKDVTAFRWWTVVRFHLYFAMRQTLHGTGLVAYILQVDERRQRVIYQEHHKDKAKQKLGEKLRENLK
jgi:hypothetical protein